MNTSPVKQKAGSQSDIRAGSPSTSQRREPHARKSSIWDSFFQYDIEYQGKASKK
jgi:hypothetical protein